MTTVILVVWWIGLIGALVLTVVILKEARLVLGTLRDIRFLADRTSAAARGIADHVAPVPHLPSTLGEREPLIAAARRLARASETFEGGIHAKLGPTAVGRLATWITQWLTGRRTQARH